VAGTVNELLCCLKTNTELYNSGWEQPWRSCAARRRGFRGSEAKRAGWDSGFAAPTASWCRQQSKPGTSSEGCQMTKTNLSNYCFGQSAATALAGWTVAFHLGKILG